MLRGTAEQRAEALRLAAQVGGNANAVLKIAERYLTFIVGPVEPETEPLADEPPTIGGSGVN